MALKRPITVEKNISASTANQVAALLAKHPIQMSFAQAATYANLSVAAAYTARLRGSILLRVCQSGNGKRLIVFTSDIIQYLQNRESQAALSVPPITQVNYKVKTGRPTKRESLDAAKAGLTVKQLRAGSSKAVTAATAVKGVSNV